MMDYGVYNVLGRAIELRKEPKGLYGLCRTLRLGDLESELLHDIFSSWEHFTGDTDYPVPAESRTRPDSVVEAAKAAYELHTDMYEGEYGALRIKLLDHLIAYLEDYLKDHG